MVCRLVSIPAAKSAVNHIRHTLLLTFKVVLLITPRVRSHIQLKLRGLLIPGNSYSVVIPSVRVFFSVTFTSGFVVIMDFLMILDFRLMDGYVLQYA